MTVMLRNMGRKRGDVREQRKMTTWAALWHRLIQRPGFHDSAVSAGDKGMVYGDSEALAIDGE